MFTGQPRSGGAYDYWATSASPVLGRGRAQRSAPLASDVLAPTGEPPRYYSFIWQVFLWLAFAVLALFVVFA